MGAHAASGGILLPGSNHDHQLWKGKDEAVSSLWWPGKATHRRNLNCIKREENTDVASCKTKVVDVAYCSVE